MNDTLSGAVSALRGASDVLGQTPRRLPALDPGRLAFGAEGPGRLGDLGHQLYLQWQRALDARAAEAQAHAARLDELADATARAGGGYQDIDNSARHQQPEVM